MEDSAEEIGSSYKDNTLGYLATIIKTLDDLKTNKNADARIIESVSKQQETFQRLKLTIVARLAKDSSLCSPLSGSEDSTAARSSVFFDEHVDDDEVILRLFREIDMDQNGAIEKEDLLKAPLLKRPENVENKYLNIRII